MAFKKIKKEDEKEKDELHKEFGILRNTVYIMGKIRQYRKPVFYIMIICAFSSALMQFLWSLIGKLVIDIVQRQSASPDKSLKPLIVLLCITTAIELVSMGINTICNSKMWTSFIYVRMKVIQERIAKALSMNYETLENPKMLDRMQKASQATGGNDNGVEGIMHSAFSMMQQTILIIVTVAVMATLSPWLILAIVIFSIVRFIFFSYTVKKDKRETWDKMSNMWRRTSYMEQTTQDFSYAKDIRLFSMKKWLMKKYENILKENYEFMRKSRNFWANNSVFTGVVSLLQNAFIYGFLIYSVVYKDITIGNFTLYLATAVTFSSTLNQLLDNIGTYKKRSLEVDDFRSFIEIPNEDNSDKIPIPMSEKYTFTFKNVSFKYTGQENYAIKNLSLTLKAGKRLAVVGLNGAGKTTFIKLLLRLYDVTEGSILLNGTDIRRFDRGEYYKLFSPVFQNVEIFAFPMSENVSMKSPDETDCTKADEKLREAGLSDKLDSLTDGVNTQLLKVIYDDGVDLSGGEKQKLALARALYKDAPIVVLDEPTAALDALAEYKLYMDFDKITEGKSAVYISHRLSSTRFCDSIAMFKSGEMVEYGTHDELLAQDGEYAKMFEVQAQYYKDNSDTNMQEMEV